MNEMAELIYDRNQAVIASFFEDDRYGDDEFIDELVDVIDESGDTVRSRLRELVPEYDSHCVPDERPPVPRKAHAK